MFDLKKEFGLKLKEHRKLAQISQEKFAEKINVSHQSLSGYETGAHFPSYPVLVRIIEVLDINPMHLFAFPEHFSDAKEDEFSVFFQEATIKLPKERKILLLKIAKCMSEDLQNKG